MKELLQEIQQALADLLRSGLDAAGPTAADRLRRLADRCEDTGLHTGAALLTQLAGQLEARAHAIHKNDLPLTQTLCRLARYCDLCEEKEQEQAILRRWREQQTGGAL